MVDRKFQISLAAARVNAGLTQRDVAEKMEVSTNTIVNWENKKSTPSVLQGRKLAKLYGIDLDRIFLP